MIRTLYLLVAGSVVASSMISSLAGCGADEPTFSWTNWNLPSNFPEPAIPEDNPMSDVKIELGRRLFYDTKLSGNQMQSCASCHEQSLAFTDGMATSMGSTGDVTPRGSMSLTNVAYAGTLTWMSPLVTHLEEQALGPMFGEDPVELGLSGLEDELLSRIAGDATYQELFPLAFAGEADPITLANITKAISTFQRILISGNSGYDRYVRGDLSAMSESAIRGMELFFTETVECFHCHGGFNFTSSLNHAGTTFMEAPFENNGLYNIDSRGAYPEPNTGLFAFSDDPQDMGRFKPPTLRNIEHTAPYMHDGSIATLGEVLDHYAAGGRNVTSGPNFGDARESPNKSGFVSGFEITTDQRTDLLNFLLSLSDPDFLTNPRFENPFTL